jgi:hypothetical protein
MRYTESYQTAGTPPSDPPEYTELVVDAIAAALDDLIVDNIHDIAASFNVDVPHLRIDRTMLDAELPNALRFLADRLDGERAKRLQKAEVLPTVNPWKLPAHDRFISTAGQKSLTEEFRDANTTPARPETQG